MIERAPSNAPDANFSSEPEEQRRLRTILLTQREINALSERRPMLALSMIFVDSLAIAAAAALAEISTSVLAYVLAVMFIGARQIGIATIIMHDAGVHGTIFASAKANRALCSVWSWLLFVFAIGQTCDSFRTSHHAHHRTVNTHDDEDRAAILSVYTMTRRQRAMTFLMALSGAAFLQGSYYMVRWGSWSVRLFFGVTSLLVLSLPFFDLGVLSLFAKYWVLPLATWGMFVNLLRASGEHFPAQSADYAQGKFRTREVVPTWFDKLFVTTRGINYHLTHHLFPSVPFFRLAAAHRLLVSKSAYLERALVVRGYHRLLVTLFATPSIPEEQLSAREFAD